VAGEKPEPLRRLPRAQRREQILAAATEAFARSGFAATSLDDIAAQAGVTRVILYRHFDSKTERYQAVLDRMCARLEAHVEEPVGGFTDASIDGLLEAAAESPPGSGCCSTTPCASRSSPNASRSSAPIYTCAAIAAATAPSTVRGDCRWPSGSPATAASTRCPAPQSHCSCSARNSACLLSKYRYGIPLDTPACAATSAIVVA
jgi:AcrR family transcriptional regulator